MAERVPVVSEDDDPRLLAEALIRASRALVGVAARSLAPLEGEVTLQQYRILVRLAERGPQRITDLATALRLNPSSISRMCDRVESKGLIVRAPAPDSRREVIVALTSDGVHLVREVVDRRRADIVMIMQAIPDSARQSTVRALQRFSDAADDSPSGAPGDAWLLGWAQ